MRNLNLNIVESSLFQAFIKELEDLHISDRDKILLGVSGGIDSMVLLTLFVSGGYNVSVANVNFNLRGKEGDEDQLFVQKWCKENDVECFVNQFDTIAVAQNKKISVEMAARDLRYDWFLSLLSAHNFRYLAIAHNANDNAETLLLNLLRGTGLKGLCGIARRNGSIIRPLLFAKRAEIEQFAKEFNVLYREDSTNSENIYKRNKIRNEVIPLLAQINPSVVETLNAETSHFRDSLSMEKTFVKELFFEDDKKNDSDKFLICSELKSRYQIREIPLSTVTKAISKYDETLVCNAISSFLADYSFSYSTSADIWNSILMQIKEVGATRIFYSDTEYIAVIERDKLKIYNRSIISDSNNLASFSMKIEEGQNEVKIPLISQSGATAQYQILLNRVESFDPRPPGLRCSLG